MGITSLVKWISIQLNTSTLSNSKTTTWVREFRNPTLGLLDARKKFKVQRVHKSLGMQACSIGGFLHEFHTLSLLHPITTSCCNTHTHEEEFCEELDYLFEVVQVQEKEVLGWWRRSPRNPSFCKSFKLQWKST